MGRCISYNNEQGFEENFSKYVRFFGTKFKKHTLLVQILQL